MTGIYMCGRKGSLFPEHLISHPLGSSWFHHSLYIHYRMCQSKDYVYGLMTLGCLPGWLLSHGLILFYHHQANGLSATKQFYHKRAHIWCAEFKFPDLSSSVADAS